MLDYIRIACAVPALKVGDPAANSCDICRWIERADEKKSDVIVFPELALTGYTCGDLFFQDALLKGALAGLRQVVSCSGEHPDITAVVGMPLQLDGLLYNCAIVIEAGQVRGIVPKSYIPDHGVYHEKRWFASAAELRRSHVEAQRLGIDAPYAIPVGAEQTFALAEGTLLGVEICEDLWAPIPPSSLLALQGAEVIVNLAASNAAMNKQAQRRQLVCDQSSRARCIYAFCSAGSTESTQDLLFSGHSIIAQCGTVRAENQLLAETDHMLVTDADLGIVRVQRRQDTSFRDAAGRWCSEPTRLTSECFRRALRSDGTRYKTKKNPFLPEGAVERQSACDEVFNIQVEGLKRRLETVGAKPVVGISGGLDSTLALLVATEAVRRMGRPLTDVHGITMPCFGTSDRTCTNALKLMEILGITAARIDIFDAVNQHFKDIGHDPKLHDTTYENAQAQERTQVLMDYAGRIGGIVVGTGDMSELALGWCTYNGDHMSMYGVNASVPKTMIPHILETVAQNAAYAAAAEVLRDIIATPISPELLPVDISGEIRQQTEDLVGPYALHDFFLYHVLSYGFTPEKIYTLACRTFADEFDGATVKKWLQVFYRRFFSQQFKRSCMPEGVAVGGLSLSPRGDWYMPSDATAQIWLEEIEKI